MKVLFVTSGNSKYHNKMPAFIESQANSLTEEGIDLSFFQISGKGVKGYLKNIIPLRRFLKKTTFDVVHAHYGFCGIVAVLARKKEKLVVSFMGESELTLDKYGKVNLALRITVFLHKLFAKHFFDLVIFKSMNLQTHISGIRHKSEVLPNGVNTARFRPLNRDQARNELGLNPSDKVILWIGDKSREVKGFKIARDAIQIVKDSYPNLKFLEINGVNNVNLPNYYNASNLFLLSSLSEGSPNVVKEAMACNTPVVATDVGDVRELFQGVNGLYLLNSFEPKEMADGIISVLTTNKRSSGRARIEELNIDIMSIASELQKIYFKVLSRTK